MKFRYKNRIRPLLNIEKKEIMVYNQIRQLNPCMDQTNLENKYARNKIRNQLIPTLEKEYNSNMKRSIIRMKEILAQDENFLENYTEKVVKKSILDNNINGIKFDFGIILNEQESIKLRAIRKILALKNGSLDGIGYIHIRDMMKLFENNLVGKKYSIGNKFTIEIIKKNIGIIE